MQADDAGTDTLNEAERKIVADYVAQTPSLADKMGADELIGHLQELEQRFGQPARE